MNAFEVFREAVLWRDMGVAVFPIHYRYPPFRKIPVSRFLPKDENGEATWNPFRVRLPTDEELMIWFRYPHNLAVVCGWQGLTVLDFDREDLFFQWLKVTGILTRTVQTSRGFHAYFFLDEPISRKFDGIHVQAAGMYVIAPPSVHESGAVYHWVLDEEIKRAGRLEEILPAQFWQAEEAAPPLHTERTLRSVTIPTPVAAADPADPADPMKPLRVVERVKARYSILDFFPDAKPSGKGHYMALCPFHDDHNPSMSINPSEGICNCQKGGCIGHNPNKPMDVINLYAKLNNMSNSEAIKDLAKNL